MNKVSVTEDIAYVGMKVMRGRDWEWGDQDGGPGNRGTIVDIRNDGWVRVKWDNLLDKLGKDNTYRIGDHGCYDLYVYVPQEKKESSIEKGMLLTPQNAYIGAIVKLRPEGEFRSAGAKLHLEEGLEYEIAHISRSLGKFSLIDLRDAGMGFDSRNFYLVNPREDMVDMARKRLEELSKAGKSLPDSQEYEAKYYDVEVTFKEKSKTNTDGNTNTAYTGTALYLPPKSYTLQRGERPEGRRLQG